jgi:hypothetical protein
MCSSRSMPGPGPQHRRGAVMADPDGIPGRRSSPAGLAGGAVRIELVHTAEPAPWRAAWVQATGSSSWSASTPCGRQSVGLCGCSAPFLSSGSSRSVFVPGRMCMGGLVRCRGWRLASRAWSRRPCNPRIGKTATPETASDFTGRNGGSPWFPYCPRRVPIIGPDVRGRPVGSFGRPLASPPVVPRPARPGVGRSESGAKSRPPLRPELRSIWRRRCCVRADGGRLKPRPPSRVRWPRPARRMRPPPARRRPPRRPARSALSGRSA